MEENVDIAPTRLFRIHPGGGACGLAGLQRENFLSSTGQYVYRCSCGFQWFLSPAEIRALLGS